MSQLPYLDEVNNNLPRLLALFDNDRTNSSHGMGDRYHWAWGLIDFNNVAFQGAVNGLARLWVNGLWPYETDKDLFLGRIDALFHAADRSIHPDGSIDQAFPQEGSYALTGFVAFDLLVCIDLLQGHAGAKQITAWSGTVGKLVKFLVKSDETHGLISNHLAGIAAALFRWHKTTSDLQAEAKALELVSRILDAQSPEGWFLEYEGADPGYQTLCSYYLADIHQVRPDLGLLEPLRRSLNFLWHFAHPDGSFGGIYGSRCTRFYYPPGIMVMAPEIPQAAALASYMMNSIKTKSVVTLSAIDETNLVPMFNAYAWAAALNKTMAMDAYTAVLPAHDSVPFRRWFVDAGMLIDRGSRHYTIINCNKGGVIYHFVDDKRVVANTGVVVRAKSGKLGSTQGYIQRAKVYTEDDKLVIRTVITEMPKQLPRPFQFMIIRMLSLTLFKYRMIREKVKQWLVRLLITRKKKWPASNLRRIKLGQDLKVCDETVLVPGYTLEVAPGPFVSIHMASQGYWQSQDERSN